MGIMMAKLLKSTLKVKIIHKMQQDVYSLGLETCVVIHRIIKQSVVGMVVIAVLVLVLLCVKRKTIQILNVLAEITNLIARTLLHHAINAI